MARDRALPKANVTVGLDMAVIERVDTLADRLRQSRSSIVRDSVELGLATLEERHQAKEPPMSAGDMPFPPSAQ